MKFSRLLFSFLFTVCILSYSVVGAQYSVDFSGLSGDYLKDNFSTVHFTLGGNSFPGGFFWFPGDDVKVKINAGGKSVICRKQLRGFYYNAMRGNRLRPLDEESLQLLKNGDTSYNNLQINGGFYTNCEGNAYGRYGQMSFTIGNYTSYLMMGVAPKIDGNYTATIIPSFENFDNITPLGYIFDSYGGVGFVGGVLTEACHAKVITQLDQGKHINEIFDYNNNATTIVVKTDPTQCSLNANAVSNAAINTMRSLAVKGNVSLSKAMDIQDRKSIKGNFGQDTVVQDTNVTLSKVVGGLKKNAEHLCKGKWNKNQPVIARGNDDVVCLDYDNYSASQRLSVDLQTDNYNGKTLIVKNRDVFLVNTMPQGKYLSVFIDNGNLLLDETVSTLGYFDADGYPVSAGSKVTQGILLQGNFFINGLVLGFNGTNIVPYNHRLFLHGKFASLNTPMLAQKERIDHVKTIPSAASHTGMVSLQNVFTWNCNPTTSKGTDGIDCGSAQEKTMSPYFIIDKDWSSVLLGTK